MHICFPIIASNEALIFPTLYSENSIYEDVNVRTIECLLHTGILRPITVQKFTMYPSASVLRNEMRILSILRLLSLLVQLNGKITVVID